MPVELVGVNGKVNRCRSHVCGRPVEKGTKLVCGFEADFGLAPNYRHLVEEAEIEAPFDARLTSCYLDYFYNREHTYRNPKRVVFENLSNP